MRETDKNQAIVDDYASGMTLVQVAARHSISIEGIKYILREMGQEIRKRGGQQKRTSEIEFTEYLGFRCKPDQHQQLTLGARLSGKPFSQWARSTLLEAAQILILERE